ncbi:hypothetical protein BGZ90_005567 [Linnemannia elongata]|nr:hypothetical protein BGZ90_005567 [Linnemannia elongata]
MANLNDTMTVQAETITAQEETIASHSLTISDQGATIVQQGARIDTHDDELREIQRVYGESASNSICPMEAGVVKNNRAATIKSGKELDFQELLELLSIVATWTEIMCKNTSVINGHH